MDGYTDIKPMDRKNKQTNYTLIKIVQTAKILFLTSTDKYLDRWTNLWMDKHIDAEQTDRHTYLIMLKIVQTANICF